MLEKRDCQAKHMPVFKQQNGTIRLKGSLAEKREPESDDRCTSRVESQRKVHWVLLPHNSVYDTFFEFCRLPRKKPGGMTVNKDCWKRDRVGYLLNLPGFPSLFPIYDKIQSFGIARTTLGIISQHILLRR